MPQDHIKSQVDENDTPVNKALRENLPDHINEVDLGSQDQKGLRQPLNSSENQSIQQPCLFSPFIFPFLSRPFLLFVPSLLPTTNHSSTGLLSPFLDPVGKGLSKGLSPVGNLIGGTGDRMAGFTKQDQPKKGEEYQKFGGKEQSGQNPLGL